MRLLCYRSVTGESIGHLAGQSVNLDRRRDAAFSMKIAKIANVMFLVILLKSSPSKLAIPFPECLPNDFHD